MANPGAGGAQNTSGTDGSGGTNPTPPGAGGSTGGTPPISTGGDHSTGGTAGAEPTAGTVGVAGNPGTAGSGPGVPPPLGSWPPPGLQLTEIASVNQPTAIMGVPGDPTTLAVAEISGRVWFIRNGERLPEPALDINRKVLVGDPNGGAERPATQGKRGLVGLAFHPNYAENGRIFVMYAADEGQNQQYDGVDGDNIFEEYKRDPANPDRFDPASGTIFLEIEKGDCGPCYQHNGGALEIDVDGFMYATTGDPPPYTGNSNSSEDLNSLMGKVLRFDISGPEVQPAGNYPGANPYVWQIGIRNAFKFSLDRVTGSIYIGDVGENSWEEISVLPYGENHRHFGWPLREGRSSFNGNCDDCVEPIAVHSANDGDAAVIGGVVYRGTAIPALQGTYIYGDYQSRRFRALQWENGELAEGPMEIDIAGPNTRPACFGQDLAGEIYVCGYDNNTVYRIDAAN